MNPILAGSPTIKYLASDVNIVFDGNSLVAGASASGPSAYMPAQLTQLPPLNGLITVKNIGVSGQTIANMRSRGTAFADANYVAGKKNILLAWEGTNSICNNAGMSGVAAGAAMAAYCADRLAAHPDWRIILLTTIPRFAITAYSIAAGNAQLSAYDDYIKANYKAMGAQRVLDVRAGGVFIYTGTTMDAVMSPYMAESIHCNDLGYGLVASYCASELRRLKAR